MLILRTGGVINPSDCEGFGLPGVPPATDEIPPTCCVACEGFVLIVLACACLVVLAMASVEMLNLSTSQSLATVVPSRVLCRLVHASRNDARSIPVLTV